jgi:NAD(P)H-dependent flavin oxidoreductase YrpB (nitropropane dioxygenase family)
MLSTVLTERLGIKYPIVAGAMMHISKPGFVAACCNAGGLGVLASAIYRSPEEFRDALKELKDLTDKPFCVNINYFPALKPTDNRRYLEILAEEGIKFIETSGHKAPEEDIPFIKESDFTWLHKCAGVRYAVKAATVGADMVTVVGYECGGATGRYDIGSMVLIPSTVSAVDIPVIGGGGVSNGKGLAAMLCLGAVGVIMGTRLLVSEECPVHPRVKEALINASLLDTAIIMRSVNATHRVWINEMANRIIELEAAKSDLNVLIEVAQGSNTKRLIDEGELNVGTISCGQGIGMIDRIEPVKEIFDSMADEASRILKNFYDR